MSIDLSPLQSINRLLFAIPLTPLQGSRFQPTGFPGLGAATFQSPSGQSLLVESAQSMANRLELMCWDGASHDLRPEFNGLSHVRVERQGAFLTDTILESHRLNSPYLLEGKDETFLANLKTELVALEQGPIDRNRLATVLLKYDVGSLLHGVFLTKSDLAGGRLRVPRALSAFIEADGVRVAPSGGVKNDQVNPSWPKEFVKKGFGNVPFARDEFTAEKTTLYVNIDLAQIRGYGLGPDVERLLILLALYKLRALLNGNLRLRSACDFQVKNDDINKNGDIKATNTPFALPEPDLLIADVKTAIAKCSARMQVTTVAFNDELKKGKADEANDNLSAVGPADRDDDEAGA